MMKLILYKIFGIEEPPCESCENLKQQIDVVNYEKRQLLEIIMRQNSPKEAQEIPRMENPKPLNVKLPWRARQQMLEAEDREKARILREQREEASKLATNNWNKVTSDSKQISVEDLEKELNIAEQAREGA